MERPSHRCALLEQAEPPSKVGSTASHAHLVDEETTVSFAGHQLHLPPRDLADEEAGLGWANAFSRDPWVSRVERSREAPQ